MWIWGWRYFLRLSMQGTIGGLKGEAADGGVAGKVLFMFEVSITVFDSQTWLVYRSYP